LVILSNAPIAVKVGDGPRSRSVRLAAEQTNAYAGRRFDLGTAAASVSRIDPALWT
jgi:hypothetical protein